MTEYERGYHNALRAVQDQVMICRKANEAVRMARNRRILFLFVNPMTFICPCVDTVLTQLEAMVENLRP